MGGVHAILCKMQKVDHSKDSAHLDLHGVRMWSG